MNRAHKQRIDYMPCPAAIEALDEAAKLFPKLTSQQALIDKLVITGLSALAHTHWTPPVLHGTNRNTWSFRSSRRPSDTGKD